MKRSIVKSLICATLSVAVIATDVIPAAAMSVSDTGKEEVVEVVSPDVETVVESTGTAGVPAQVTGVAVSGEFLTWDAQTMTAHGYDIKAVDTTTGITYYSWDTYDEATGKWVYGFDSATSHSCVTGSQSYSLSNNLYTSTADAADFGIPGRTYNYQVRAVNRVSAKDAEGKTTYTYAYGPWSAVVAYTVPKYVPLQISVNTQIKNENYLVLNLNQKIQTGRIYAEVYSDAACTQKVTQDSNMPSGDGTLLMMYLGSSFEAGKTYYVKVYNANQRYNDATEMAAVGATYSNVVAFTVPAKAVYTAPAIADLKAVNSTDGQGYNLTTAALNTMSAYEIQHGVYYYYSLDANAPENEWNSLGSTNDKKGLKVSYKKLAEVAGEPGKAVYIKAKSYVETYDATEGDFVTSYSAFSNVITLAAPAITNITGLYYEQTSSGYSLRYTGNAKENETVMFQYSTDKNFVMDFSMDEDKKKTKETNAEFLSYEDLVPGQTYYVRAYVRSDYYDSDVLSGFKIGAYSNVITITAQIPEVDVYPTVTAKSVTLNMYESAEGMITGYEVSRKNGKKYEVLEQTIDNVYTDSKLKSDTTYTYRVRGYYYNPDTKVTTYGDYTYVDANTWGSALGLKAVAKSATSVKLTWKKVADADGYEVYRYVGEGKATLTSTYAESNGAFSKAKLLKTIKGAKKKSYIDKNLTSGASYNYYVRAYREVNGEKYYITEYAYVTLDLVAPEITKVKQSVKNGKTTVNWNRVMDAKGYLIEKYDNNTDKWVTVKKINKNKTTKYVAPAVTGQDVSVQYRIRSFTGKKYSAAEYFTVHRGIGVVSNVKTKTSSATGSVTISWKAVSGADYYKVYRTTSSDYTTNAVTGKVNRKGSLVYSYTKDSEYTSGYKTDSYVTTTSLVDQKISYTDSYGEELVLSEGPKTGVKYYYYVVAYKIVDEDYDAIQAAKDKENLSNYTSVSSYGCGKPVAATVAASKPAKPVIKSAKSSKKKQVKITLKAAVAGAEYYEIYRSANKKKGYELIGTTTKTTYVDKKAKSKKTYYYKVKSVKSNDVGVGVSSALSKASAKVKVK